MNKYVAFKPIIFQVKLAVLSVSPGDLVVVVFPKKKLGPQSSSSLEKRIPKIQIASKMAKPKTFQTNRRWIRCTPKCSWETFWETHGGIHQENKSWSSKSFLFSNSDKTRYAAPRSTALWFNCGSLVWTLSHVAVHCFAIHQAPRYWTFEKIRGSKVRGQ